MELLFKLHTTRTCKFSPRMYLKVFLKNGETEKVDLNNRSIWLNEGLTPARWEKGQWMRDNSAFPLEKREGWY